MDYRVQIDKYLSYIDSIRKMRGKDYQKSGRVKINSIENEINKSLIIDATVRGSNNTNYTVNISIKNEEFGQKFKSDCSCLDGSLQCKHVAAVLHEIKDNSKYLEKIEEKEKYKKGKELIDIIESIDSKEESKSDKEESIDDVNRLDVFDGFAKLKLKLYVPEDSKNLYIELYIGKIDTKVFYRVKDLIEFSDNILDNKYSLYSSTFGITHKTEKFEEDSKKILKFILKHSEALKSANEAIDDINIYRYRNIYIKGNRLKLSGAALDDFFNIMKGEEVEIKIANKRENIYVKEKAKEFKILIEKSKENDYAVKTNLNSNSIIIQGYKYQYLIVLDVKQLSIYKITNKLNKAEIKILEMTKSIKKTSDNKNEILIKEQDIHLFISKILPKIKKSFDMKSIEGTEIEKLLPKKLKVKIYLDYNKKGCVTLKPIYCYDDIELNPLEKTDVEYQNYRDVIAESSIERIFKQTGFEKDDKNEKYLLKSDEDIYRFLTIDIAIYMKKFEVLVTNEFKEQEVKRPKIGSMGVKVENNLINIEFLKMNMTKEDLVYILKQYRLKKKYYRLKDGKFLNLENNKDLEIISETAEIINLDIKKQENGEFKIPLYRSMYLNNILSLTEKIDIKKDKSFNDIITKLNTDKGLEYKVPLGVIKILRDYQKVGYNWLKTIGEYKFGGILADDMGLGKTLQTISVVLSYIEKCKKNNIKPKPSIVVCPSSLSLNWKNEVEKFNTNINVMVIKGIAKERQKQIKNIKKHELIIVSYDLIKRDIEEYSKENIEFKYIIADEAQYIKNSNTQNAKSIKKLVGETRYALTGTPIENSLSELWSIFDYILPGYLYSYNKFKNNIEIPIVRDKDIKAMEKLKMLIAPFIIRRLKKEVLKELPDKTISIINNEMEEEQERIYNLYLMQAKKEVRDELTKNGLEKSQMKILALLTRLRQVCCHPSLFIDNYKGESSKLIQCMELVTEAIASSHKMLIFSQYTSMFEIIEKELKARKIKYFKLTGKTKVGDRVKLVDDFNKAEDVKVFLISLKAGGTGLNLTAADTVIHYDPWWNLSAENQATDRAYRIGQKKAVQVYKLITSNTIEEKIQKMQEKKGKLTDDVLTNEEVFINKLSKEEIVALFE